MPKLTEYQFPRADHPAVNTTRGEFADELARDIERVLTEPKPGDGPGYVCTNPQHRACTGCDIAKPDPEVARLRIEVDLASRGWNRAKKDADSYESEIARLTDEADTAIQQATNMAEDVESLRAAITAALAKMPSSVTDAYDILSAALSAPAPVSQPSEAETRPHSRACGWRLHAHGAECSTNCPTCHGRQEQNR